MERSGSARSCSLVIITLALWKVLRTTNRIAMLVWLNRLPLTAQVGYHSDSLVDYSDVEGEPLGRTCRRRDQQILARVTFFVPIHDAVVKLTKMSVLYNKLTTPMRFMHQDASCTLPLPNAGHQFITKITPIASQSVMLERLSKLPKFQIHA
jgi:hypothetical protein